MKFAHFADCHIGSWRDQKLKDISVKAFVKAINACIEQKVDFIIISGDLFNTSVPSIDSLKEAVKKLKELKDIGIPVYGVAGSHDFSAAGKTMIDVLENAGIFKNVFNGRVHDKKLVLDFTQDMKTGAKMTGIIGKKGMLDRKFYEILEKTGLEKEKGYKIFLFHTAIDEIKPKELERIDSAPMDFLPKGFNYYAGGHVHYIFEQRFPGFGWIVYPGALFPTNFHDLEKYSKGGFYIVEVNEGKDGAFTEKLRWEPVQVINTFHIKIDCSNKTAKQAEEEIYSEIKTKEFVNTIVTIRLFGRLKQGKASDVDFKGIFEVLNDKSAYYVMKSTSMLESDEFKEGDMQVGSDSVDDSERKIVKQHLGRIKVDGLDPRSEEELMHRLLQALSIEKAEGEKNADFEKRVVDEVGKILDV
ncbi:hypothetical protein COV19_03770 [Candidatus Woesearchaeota archaeon CG10_big_fil_rev_8_21_14_0_10_44_13]|nr:MAG: hypothetical protein COV19_03770 [Candidatus Woesearchaeota archaeon CG10_big_fil_rev_8_21_14_0_10_44_13]